VLHAVNVHRADASTRSPRAAPPRYVAHMDWKLFGTTFVAIFVAELGDKTQLATLSLSAEAKSRWVVFAASALALVCTSAIAVIAGDAVARFIPPVWLKRAAAAVFIVLGVLMLVRQGAD
jgi:putative Ca2+/H+ antiporter (TMEM165/GDT1 family)